MRTTLTRGRPSFPVAVPPLDEDWNADAPPMGAPEPKELPELDPNKGVDGGCEEPKRPDPPMDDDEAPPKPAGEVEDTEPNPELLNPLAVFPLAFPNPEEEPKPLAVGAPPNPEGLLKPSDDD